MKWPRRRTAAKAAAPAKRPRRAGLTALFQPRVLMIDADGTGARAAIARRHKGAWQLGPLVCSPAGEPQAQLTALLEALQAEGERPPNEVLLSSGACVSALLDLPVDPAKPRPDGQMREMTRYDMETVVAQHNNLWTLGEILQAVGALDGAQRHRVAVALEERRVNAGTQPYRFGEVAIEEGLLSRTQVDDALERQHAQQLLDSDLACAWQAVRIPEGVVHDGPRWLGAACAPEWRDAWRHTLHAAGLKLKAIAPAGLLPLLPGREETSERAQVLISIRSEQLLRARRHGARFDGLEAEPRMEQAITAAGLYERIVDWTLDEPERIRLVAADPALSDAALDDLAQQLASLARTECQVDAPDAEATTRAGWLGWLDDRDRDRDRRLVPQVPARLPAAPPWRSRGGRQFLAVAAALLAVVVWEAKSRWDLAAMRHELDTLRDASERRSNDTSAADAARAAALNEQLDTARTALSDTLAQAERLEAIARRTDTIPALIRLLATTIDPQIVLEALRESRGTTEIGIQVDAWSTNDAIAQRFALSLQDAVRPLGLSVAQADLQSSTGRTGAPGYRLTFWLIPAEPEDGFGDTGEARP